MRIWLIGHGGFYNRGCEAIVRSTLALLREAGVVGTCRLFSMNPQADRQAMHEQGLEIFDVADYYHHGFHSRRFDIRIARRVGTLGSWGRAARTAWLRRLGGGPDCVLSIGGDNFTLDYGLPSRFVAELAVAMEWGVPCVIWGASVGPFAKDSAFEREMASFLRRVSLITARESATVDYLDSIGVKSNVIRTWDPAFALKPAARADAAITFPADGNLVGLNISALLAKWYPSQDLTRMLTEATAFVQTLVAKGATVLLIPHVTKPGNELVVNDELFLQQILGQVHESHGRVQILPGNLDASQIKWAISQCRFMIASRTHATIAALSSGVPTIAIAYSRKARGIWRDVFGHEHYLLPTDQLSRYTLLKKLQLLEEKEVEVRRHLAELHPTMIEGAKANVQALLAVLRRNQHLGSR